MDIMQMQDILTYDIEDLSRLHDRLSNGGESLSAVDKRVLRFQLSGTWLTDMHREQRVMFAEGSYKGIERSHKYIIDTMKQLS